MGFVLENQKEDHIVGEDIKGDDKMGLMDFVQKTYDSTNKRMSDAEQEAGKIKYDDELIERWRNCREPIKKTAYYKEMKNRGLV